MKYDEICPHCGLAYRDFRTGLDFAAVRSMLWVDKDDPARWRQKRRCGVLGFWHQLKLDMWKIHLRECHDEYIHSSEETPF